MVLLEEIIKNLIKNKVTERETLLKIKSQTARAKNERQPSNNELISAYKKMLRAGKIKANPVIERLLRRREVRSLSGVAIVTALTKPYPCPGQCIYCPDEKDMPKSYLKSEPAAARAYKLKFDPYKQVQSRIQTLYNNGHPTDKIELIIKGGSWNVYPRKYQKWFIKRCFEAANSLSNPLRSLAPKWVARANSPKSVLRSLAPKFKFKSLGQAIKENERAKHRIVGITLETRPDLITLKEIARMRELGCTRVELGAQSIYDDVLSAVKRGHSASDIADATKLLKNAGFKVDYHLMPGLPGSNGRRDFRMFQSLFSDSRFQPDAIKIYPCAVIPGTKLYKSWKAGKFKPLDAKQLVNLLVKVKTIIPRYTRISRLIRDIPSTEIAAGNKITNLREFIQKEMKRRSLKCKCLRCREIGHQDSPRPSFEKRGGNPLQSPFSKGGGKGNLQLFTQKYKASGGAEHFLSFEDKERQIVYAFCRLRLPRISHSDKQKANHSEFAILPEIKGAAHIRELHTYGCLVPISLRKKGAPQHRGLGKLLMKKAEEIACDNGYTKMAVISGIGAREYYRKLGYRKKGTYMIKLIDKSM